MATMANPPDGALGVNGSIDPFVSSPSLAHPSPHRYSNFDTSLFSQYPSNSPSQTKRALEAHMKDTDRRIQDASRLGTTLLQQRKDLAARLKDVELVQNENEIGPDLRNRLSELEKEYNEVGKESARAFLPKSRATSSDVPEMTPSVISTNSRESPSKVSAPSRKQRNEPTNRVHDIEFATEISTSLLSQVRQLQAVLAEKDEAFNTVSSDRARLETELASLAQRVKHMDESEQRYKDENWNLETQLQEVQATMRTSTDKELRLTQSLKAHQEEKAAAQRELDDLSVSHQKLTDSHEQAKKQQEAELHTLRRDIASHENEKQKLHSKVNEMTVQNTELAKAVSSSWNRSNQSAERDSASETEDGAADMTTPEQSPPASPVKGTPRHGMLESETLKSSLTHAHRMIQNLKNNIHREKTEKIELKRMLQDARDELESRRSESGSGSIANVAKKRRSEADNAKFRKPMIPGKLGASTNSQTEVIMDEDDWEEHDAGGTPSKARSRSAQRLAEGAVAGAALFAGFDHEVFGSQEKEGTDAFETANERDGTATETDAFMTGAETLDGDSDLTETENDLQHSGTVKASGVSPLTTTKARDRRSLQSTASISGDELDDVKTPAAVAQPKYRLKLNRNSRRSGRPGDQSTDSPSNNSPAVSIASSQGTPHPPGQSLGDELDALSDEGDTPNVTPSKILDEAPETQREVSAEPEVSSPFASPVQPNDTTEEGVLAHQAHAAMMAHESTRSKPVMVDASMMTEPWVPESQNTKVGVDAGADTKTLRERASDAVGGALAGFGLGRIGRRHMDKDATAEAAPEDAVMSRAGAAAGSTVSTGQPSAVRAREPLASEGPERPVTSTGALADEYAFQPNKDVAGSPEDAVAGVRAGASADTPMDDRQTAGGVLRPKLSQPKMLRDSMTDPLQEKKSLQALHDSMLLQAPPVQKMAVPALTSSAIVSQQIEPIAPIEPWTPFRPTTSIVPNLPGRAGGLQALTEATSKPDVPLPARLADNAELALSSISSQAMGPVNSPPTPPKRSLRRLGATYADVADGTAPTDSAASNIVPGTDSARPGTAFFATVAASEPDVDTDTATSAPRFFGTTTPVSTRSKARSLTRRSRGAEVFSDGTTASPIEPRVYGGGKGTGAIPTLIFGDSDDLNDEPELDESLRAPLVNIPTTFVQGQRNVSDDFAIPITKFLRIERKMADEGSQTSISGQDIENMLRNKNAAVAAAALGGAALGGRALSGAEEEDVPMPLRSSTPTGTVSPGKSADGSVAIDAEPVKAPRRQASAGSMRSVKGQSTLPPLPPDHTQRIAAAAGKAPLTAVAPGTMGPPAMPASAYKANRPRTPSAAASTSRGASRDGTTPRAPRQGANRDILQTPISRRTSVSSFASELDERFNITRRQIMYQPASDQSTDPRMIQAITQTMIGEYLWKYTRKAGRSETSSTRHRRFFWVHPYTRTLYWSDKDPSTASREMLKSKSVAIEAVRVVTDDNTYPPGLHRKSIVVLTPGRQIVFTAPTSQRHETWFNALSYLLLRSEQERAEAANEITQDDVDEFNPGGFSIRRSISRMTGGPRSHSRTSLSSYNSRTARTSSPQRTQASTTQPGSLAQRQSQAALRSRALATPTPNPGDASTASRTSTMQESITGSQSGRLSSLAGMFRAPSSMRGTSFSSRRSRTSASIRHRNGVGEDGVYDPSVVDDSAEDLRAVIEQQERDGDRVENVRACCDGKHDVGSLPRVGRHGTRFSRQSHSHTYSHSHPRAEPISESQQPRRGE